MISSTQEQETGREVVQLAVNAGRTQMSKQTGFVHFNYSGSHHLETIALYENYCFVLALLRSKQREECAQAKTLLERLLKFEVEGDFPLYLHEFPQCVSPSHSINVAIPLFLMVERYALHIGEKLAHSLKELLERILTRAPQKSLSWNASMKFAALQGRFDPDEWHPKSPRDWSDFLICCTLSGADASKALTVWDPHFALFTGSNLWQEGTAPAVSLLDLFMCTHFETWSKRARSAHPSHLHAALVYPLKAPNSNAETPSVHCSEDPFTLYWGELEDLHSLALRTTSEKCTIERTKGGFELLLTLPESSPRPDALEASLFLNRSAQSDIKVCNSKATTFGPGDAVTITSDTECFTITFEVVEGSGSFFGHIFHGNRPNQIACKGDNRYTCYDWQIALRTISRSNKSTIRVRVMRRGGEEVMSEE